MLEEFDSQKHREHFQNELNLSFIPEDYPIPTNKEILHHYLCSILLYGIALIVLLFHPWYKGLYNAEIMGVNGRDLFLSYYIIYCILAPAFLFTLKPKKIQESKNVLIVNYLKNLLLNFNSEQKKWILGLKSTIVPTYKERQALMAFFIKFFFGSLMVGWGLRAYLEVDIRFNSVYLGFMKLMGWSSFTSAIPLNWDILFDNAFFLVIYLVFFLDTAIFGIGYLTETAFLKNKIRYVEDSVIGIFVCLMCYLPFNAVTIAYIESYPDDNAAFYSDKTLIISKIFRVVAAISISIYASASVALFTKASNLTNRGIVTSGPYSVVRHPAYISKTIFWWLTTIPLFFVLTDFGTPAFNSHIIKCIGMFLSLIAWSTIYYLRAMTEERLLSKDPDYIEYCQKVKYRFIPFIW